MRWSPDQGRGCRGRCVLPYVPGLASLSPPVRAPSLLGSGLLLLVTGVLLLASCSFPGSVKPTIKIGLSAPFEGRYRDLGYEVLHAVRLAVRQRNAAGGIDDRYLLELVALNDFDEADEAVMQARKMAVDPGVLGVLGGWSQATAGLAWPEYERLGLPFLTPGVEFAASQPAGTVDAEFQAAYEELSGGAPPGAAAAWAYDAANRLLDALEVAAQAEGRPTRASVQAALER